MEATPSVFSAQYPERGHVHPAWTRQELAGDVFTYQGKLGRWRVYRPFGDSLRPLEPTPGWNKDEWGDETECGPNVLMVKLAGEDHYRVVYTMESSRNLEWASWYISACERVGRIITDYHEAYGLRVEA